MIAIKTKYAAASGTMKARIIATCDEGQCVMLYDDEQTEKGNHRAASQQLACKLGYQVSRKLDSMYSVVFSSGKLNGAYYHAPFYRKGDQVNANT